LEFRSINGTNNVAELEDKKLFFYDSKDFAFHVKWHIVILTGRAYMPGADYLIKDEKGVSRDNPRYKVPAFPVDKTIYPRTELEDWHEIAEPARALLESFVVDDSNNSTKLP
jgi:hypothetical protein